MKLNFNLNFSLKRATLLWVILALLVSLFLTYTFRGVLISRIIEYVVKRTLEGSGFSVKDIHLRGLDLSVSRAPKLRISSLTLEAERGSFRYSLELRELRLERERLLAERLALYVEEMPKKRTARALRREKASRKPKTPRLREIQTEIVSSLVRFTAKVGGLSERDILGVRLRELKVRKLEAKYERRDLKVKMIGEGSVRAGKEAQELDLSAKLSLAIRRGDTSLNLRDLPLRLRVSLDHISGNLKRFEGNLSTTSGYSVSLPHIAPYLGSALTLNLEFNGIAEGDGAGVFIKSFKGSLVSEPLELSSQLGSLSFKGSLKGINFYGELREITSEIWDLSLSLSEDDKGYGDKGYKLRIWASASPETFLDTFKALSKTPGEKSLTLILRRVLKAKEFSSIKLRYSSAEREATLDLNWLLLTGSLEGDDLKLTLEGILSPYSSQNPSLWSLRLTSGDSNLNLKVMTLRGELAYLLPSESLFNLHGSSTLEVGRRKYRVNGSYFGVLKINEGLNLGLDFGGTLELSDKDLRLSLSSLSSLETEELRESLRKGSIAKAVRKLYSLNSFKLSIPLKLKGNLALVMGEGLERGSFQAYGRYSSFGDLKFSGLIGLKGLLDDKLRSFALSLTSSGYLSEGRFDLLTYLTYLPEREALSFKVGSLYVGGLDLYNRRNPRPKFKVPLEFKDLSAVALLSFEWPLKGSMRTVEDVDLSLATVSDLKVLNVQLGRSPLSLTLLSSLRFNPSSIKEKLSSVDVYGLTSSLSGGALLSWSSLEGFQGMFISDLTHFSAGEDLGGIWLATVIPEAKLKVSLRYALKLRDAIAVIYAERGGIQGERALILNASLVTRGYLSRWSNPLREVKGDISAKLKLSLLPDDKGRRTSLSYSVSTAFSDLSTEDIGLIAGAIGYQSFPLWIRELISDSDLRIGYLELRLRGDTLEKYMKQEVLASALGIQGKLRFRDIASMDLWFNFSTNFKFSTYWNLNRNKLEKRQVTFSILTPKGAKLIGNYEDTFPKGKLSKALRIAFSDFPLSFTYRGINYHLDSVSGRFALDDKLDGRSLNFSLSFHGLFSKYLAFQEGQVEFSYLNDVFNSAGWFKDLMGDTLWFSALKPEPNKYILNFWTEGELIKLLSLSRVYLRKLSGGNLSLFASLSLIQGRDRWKLQGIDLLVKSDNITYKNLVFKNLELLASFDGKDIIIDRLDGKFKDLSERRWGFTSFKGKLEFNFIKELLALIRDMRGYALYSILNRVSEGLREDRIHLEGEIYHLSAKLLRDLLPALSETPLKFLKGSLSLRLVTSSSSLKLALKGDSLAFELPKLRPVRVGFSSELSLGFSDNTSEAVFSANLNGKVNDAPFKGDIALTLSQLDEDLDLRDSLRIALKLNGFNLAKLDPKHLRGSLDLSYLYREGSEELSLSFNELEVFLGLFREPLRISGLLRYLNGKLEDKLSLSLGKQPVKLEGIALRGGALEVKLSYQGETELKFPYLRYTGEISSEVTLIFSKILGISGTFQASEGNLSLNFSERGSAGGEAPLNISLTINMDNVKLNIPFLKTTFSGVLNLNYSKGSLSMRGKMDISKGTLTLGSSLYKVESGYLEWEGTPIPYVDLVAKSLGADESFYVLLRGPLDNPQLTSYGLANQTLGSPRNGTFAPSLAGSYSLDKLMPFGSRGQVMQALGYTILGALAQGLPIIDLYGVQTSATGYTTLRLGKQITPKLFLTYAKVIDSSNYESLRLRYSWIVDYKLGRGFFLSYSASNINTEISILYRRRF